MKDLTKFFEYHHNNPPEPFNKSYNPQAKTISDNVSKEMEAEGYYDTHTREECAIERSRRINERMG